MPNDLSELLETTSEHASSQLDSLCRPFLAIARNKLSGTLVVTDVDESYTCFLCDNGLIADLDTGREHTLLTEAIFDSGEVPQRTLRKAEKTAEKRSVTLGGALLELNAVAEEKVLEAIQRRIAEAVAEVFSWQLDQVHFTPHSSQETLEGFRSELSEYFDLRANPEELFLGAAQRHERWDLVEANFDLLRDVFYATPGTFRYFREPDVYPRELAILNATDGTRDVQEVVDESGLDRFDAIKIVRRLAHQGEIELINPVQLFQLATEMASNDALEKACRLFQRSKERGLDDFDLELRLAETLDRLGRNKEAAKWYLSFSTRSLSQLRIDEAVSCLRRVAKIVPEQNTALDKLLEIFLQQKRTEEALEVALEIVNVKEKQHRHSTALRMLVGLKSHLDGAPKFHEKIVELAELCRQPEIAREEKKLLARTFDEHKNAEQAIETYESMLREGNESLEIRLQLVELHRRQGNRQKAVDHVSAVLSAGGETRVRKTATLLSLHTTMVELEPGDSRSSRWLVDHHLENGHDTRAIEVLNRWRNELEGEDDLEELASVLEKLVKLDGDLDHRWTLATVLEKLGRGEESRRTLRRLAQLANGEEKFDQADRALDLILEQSPLDVETRKIQVDLLDTRGEEKRAAEKLEEIATLEIIAGNLQEAEGLCRRVLLVDPNAADVVDRLGALCRKHGEQKKATEQLVKAARIHLENENFGLGRRTIEKLFEIDAGNQTGAGLLRELEVRKAPAAAASAESSAAVPPGEPARGPFQHSPQVVKTSVAGITAKLRNLKSNDPSPGKRVEETGTVAAKLDEPHTDTPSADAKGTKPAPDNPSSPAPSSGGNTPGQAPATARIQQKLGGAASRLAALRESQ